ncbi:MAG: hypothetical protein AB7H48_07850 [Parachlamydiales bacterium]
MFQLIRVYHSKQKNQTKNTLFWVILSCLILAPTLSYASAIQPLESVTTFKILSRILFWLAVACAIMAPFGFFSSNPLSRTFATIFLGLTFCLFSFKAHSLASSIEDQKVFVQAFEESYKEFSEVCPERSSHADVVLLLCFSNEPEKIYNELVRSRYFSISAGQDEKINGYKVQGFNAVYTQLSVDILKEEAWPISMNFNPLILKTSKEFPELNGDRLLRVVESPYFFTLSKSIQDTLIQNRPELQKIIFKKLFTTIYKS